MLFLAALSPVVGGGLAIAGAHSAFSASARAFVALALCSIYATGIMSTFANGRVEALRFLRVTPLPVAPKWLLFLPVAGAGVLIALASLTVLPTLAAVALFGCWCWTTAMGHWFAGTSLRSWMLGWPLSFVPLGVAAAFHRSGGWAASATATLALGSVGWLAAPRERTAALSAPGDAAGPRTWARPARHSARRWTALRMLLLSEILMRRSWSVLSAILLIIFALVALVNPLSTTNGAILMVACAGFLAGANAPAIRDFLATQPITRSQRFRGLILPWCLLAAMIPGAGLLGAGTVTTMDGSQIMRLAYPRDEIRAAWSPTPDEQGAEKSTEIAVSPALRRLLLGQVSRVVLLQIALFASATTWNLAHARVRRRRRQRSTSMVVSTISFALMIPFWARLSVPWSPPLWLVVTIAALAIWLLVRELAELDTGRRV